MERPKPVPADRDVLVRIRAAGVTAGDCELRALRFGVGMRVVVRLIMGVRRPRGQVLGQEFSGEVEAVGARVVRFRVGDRVFGTTGFGFGAYAEYLCRPEEYRDGALGIMPQNVSFEEAATIPTGGFEALHFLRRAGGLRGKRILVIGAGGGIGALAVQIAVARGATVTGVDRSEKLAMIRRLGAVRAIDSTREEYTQGADRYDVVFDAVGRSRFSATLRLLVPGGFYLVGNPRWTVLLRARWGWGRRGRTVAARGTAPKSEELDELRRLVEAGSLRSPLDRLFRLEETRQAHERVDSGLAVGRVAITLSLRTPDDPPVPLPAPVEPGR